MKFLNERLPSLTCLEDLDKQKVELPQLVDVAELYRLAVNTSHDEYYHRAGYHHPSAVGYCMRSTVYQYYETPPTDRRSKEMQEIMNLGHAVHDLVQKGLERMEEVMAPLGVKVEFMREVPHDPATDELRQVYGIGGTTDGLLQVSTPRWTQYGVIEIKSSNDEWFKKVKAQATANPKHLKQSHIYAYRFNAPIIWVMYYDKDNSRMEVKPHLFDPQTFHEALEYFMKCNEYIAKKELPPREESYFECSECIHRSLCKPAVLQPKRKVARSAPPTSSFARKKK